MDGEYIILEFADWNQDSTTSLFDKNKDMKGKPKDIVVMKGEVVSKYHFDNIIGVQFGLKRIDFNEHKRIKKVYEEWKRKNKE